MKKEGKGRRKPPRGGHRAGMRRDALRDRLRLAALVILGGALASGLVYLNFIR